jgi:hypothetical protein
MRLRVGWSAALVACILGVATVAGCGSSSRSASGFGSGSQEAALASLRLNTEAAALQSEMGKLVGGLGADPSPARQAAVRLRLVALDREAAALISKAAAASTYEVALHPLNGAGVVGTATLVESDGKVAMHGTLRGLSGGDHPVAIYALGAGEGRSVCPPGNAAAGADGILSAREAAVFYGRPALPLGSVEDSSAKQEMSFSGPARRSSPLDVRAVVVGGGPFKGGYAATLPVACGVPAVAPGGTGASSAGELVAAVTQTRAAGVEVALLVGDPTTAAAAAARARAEAHLQAATGHLAAANHLAIRDLRGAGEVTAEDRRAVAGAMAAAGSSHTDVQGGMTKLKAEVERERREERRRLVQRHAAQRAARQAAEAKSAAAEPSPEPEISAEPEPEYESAPEPAPEPAPEAAPPPAPEGPTIASP